MKQKVQCITKPFAPMFQDYISAFDRWCKFAKYRELFRSMSRLPPFARLTTVENNKFIC